MLCLCFIIYPCLQVMRWYTLSVFWLCRCTICCELWGACVLQYSELFTIRFWHNFYKFMYQIRPARYFHISCDLLKSVIFCSKLSCNCSWHRFQVFNSGCGFWAPLFSSTTTSSVTWQENIRFSWVNLVIMSVPSASSIWKRKEHETDSGGNCETLPPIKTKDR